MGNAKIDRITAEDKRLADNASHKVFWKKWGPYLSERQWGTVREDYSADSEPWEYFPRDHARSRVYRWGEDGLGGISDINQDLCFSLALWNGRDPILKERLFGLSTKEGNHREDVKELCRDDRVVLVRLTTGLNHREHRGMILEIFKQLCELCGCFDNRERS